MNMDDFLEEMGPHILAFMELDYLFHNDPNYLLDFLSHHSGEHLCDLTEVNLLELSPIMAPMHHFSNMYTIGKTQDKETILLEVLFFPEEHYRNYGPYDSFWHYDVLQRKFLTELMQFIAEDAKQSKPTAPYHFDRIISIHLNKYAEKLAEQQINVHIYKADK